MAPFSSLRRKIGSLFSSRTSQNIPQPHSQAHHPSEVNLSQGAGATLRDPFSPNDDSEEYDSDAENAQNIEPLGRDKKRKRSLKPAPESRSSKRPRGLKDISQSHLDETSLTALNPSVKAKGGRGLMPPPATPMAKSTMVKRKSISDNITDLGSLAPSTAIRKEAAQLDAYDLEKARRYAEAHKLPADSADWSQAEKDLFYHLSMRGFEPLLPNNWMIDFRTLPLSLYATDDTDTPLIQPNKDNEFRGIRTLRDLMDLGENIRGRITAASPRAPEPEIRRRISAFLQWTLTDSGLSGPDDTDPLPALITTAMKPRQTTQEAIQELSTRLHALAQTWQSTIPSIDTSTANPPASGQLIDSDSPLPSVEDHPEPPTLYGFLICSSLVMIVTKSLHHPQNHNLISTPLTIKTEGHPDVDPVSTLRVIATLDLSRHGQDVWNALALAIVCVCVRNTMVEYRGRRVGDEDEEESGDGEEDGEGDEDVDDPDA